MPEMCSIRGAFAFVSLSHCGWCTATTVTLRPLVVSHH
jgi:hypothetical protein